MKLLKANKLHLEIHPERFLRPHLFPPLSVPVVVPALRGVRHDPIVLWLGLPLHLTVAPLRVTLHVQDLVLDLEVAILAAEVRFEDVLQAPVGDEDQGGAYDGQC